MATIGLRLIGQRAPEKQKLVHRETLEGSRKIVDIHKQKRSPFRNFVRSRLTIASCAILYFSVFACLLLTGFRQSGHQDLSLEFRPYNLQLKGESSAEVVQGRRLLQASPTNTYNIQLVCSVTKYSSSCLAALLSEPRAATATTPQGLVAVLTAISKEHSLAAIIDSQTLAMLAQTVNNVNLTAVSTQCSEVLDLAAYHLQNLEAAFAGMLYQDIQAWLSGALSQSNDCYYALGSFRGTLAFVSDMEDRLNTTVELISNSLTLTDAFITYGPDAAFWQPPPESRPDQLRRLTMSSYSNTSPEWLGKRDQALFDTLTPQEVLDLVPSVTVSLDSMSPSIQAAVNQAPSWSPTRYVIYIKAGVYNEIVRIPKDKINVMFVGDGANLTIITGNMHVQTPGITTWLSATVAVNGAGFIARGITFENTAGPGQYQAVALRVSSDKSAFQGCYILGHQDSLYTHSLRQFYKDCTIAGTVDFIFGNSAAVFQTCNIVVRVGRAGSSTSTLTAQGRIDPGQNTALVFQNCSVYGTPDYETLQQAEPTMHRVYLGRPWKTYSRTIFTYTYLSQIVYSGGWSAWNGTFALDTLLDAEYGSYGPGASNMTQRIYWSTQLSLAQAEVFSAQRFLQADTWLPATAIPYSPPV